MKKEDLKMSKTLVVLFSAALSLGLCSSTFACGAGLTPQEQLGKLLFFDKSLSTPPGQSCAVCHGPGVGYTGPVEWINITGSVYQGAVPGRFGNRKPPTAAYAGDSPVLHYDADEGTWVGGMFWDGRATGDTLGDPLAEQALGPFLNPLEQNNASPQAVIDKVLASSYRGLFLRLCPECDAAGRYECIGRAIAAYERSREVSPFTSKYDYWLKGKARLTSQEQRGLALFNGKGKCAACHVPPLFTDNTYDNLGVPRNPLNPFYRELKWNPAGKAWVDPGLGGYLQEAGFAADVYQPEWGKFKVPTLRNLDKRPYKCFVKAYGHNGFFKSLREIVHFYNTRDLPGAGWPPPEVADNVNITELGDLGLSCGEENDLTAFLKTLSDGFTPNSPDK
jgi:cytochrome c peroxidase